MAPYLPEGNLTHYEYERLRDALPDARLVNAHDIIDSLSLIKEPGEINRFREGLAAGGYRSPGGLRGDQRWRLSRHDRDRIGGLAAYAMRKAGSEWEWSFTGGNEIASGYRTGFAGGACTPASRRPLQAGRAVHG